MDLSASEIEYSTALERSLPSLPAAANDVTDQPKQSSKKAQSNSENAGTDERETQAGPSGIRRERLVAPPTPTSDLELDHVARAHIQALIKQSVENVGLQDRSWEELLAPLPEEVLALVTANVIDRLAHTRNALTNARTQLQIRKDELKALATKGKAGPGKASKEHPKGQTGEKQGTPGSPDLNKEVEVNELEDIARHLLLETLNAESQTNNEPVPSTSQAGSSLPRLTKFLICVSEDVGNSRRATFEPGVFNGAPLFQGDDEDAENMERSFINEETYHYVGGTINLKAPEREWNRIEKNLALLVYAACHLKLEMHLLRDCGSARPPPLPEKEPLKSPEMHANGGVVEPSQISPVVTPLTSPTLTTVQEQSITESPAAMDGEALSPVSSNTSEEAKAPSKGHNRKWSRGLVGLLFRTSPEQPQSQFQQGHNKLKRRLTGRLKMHRTRSLTRKSEDVARPSPTSPREDMLRMPGAIPLDDWELVAPEKKVVIDMARTEEEQAGETLTAPGSPVLPKALPPTPSVPAIEKAVATIEEEDRPEERFKRVIDRMAKAILSVSPGVKFPPPSLLVFLREQEQQSQNHNAENARIPGRPLLGRIKSYTGSPSPAMSPTFEEGLPSSSSTPMLPPSLAPASPIPTPVTAMSTKISVDSRAGLSSLMTGNNSLDGTLRHQALPCLFEKLLTDSKISTSLCQVPIWRKLVYYDYDNFHDPWFAAQSSLTDIGDICLSKLFDLLADASGTVCPGKCGKPVESHTFSLIHGSRKVSMTTKKSLLASTEPDNMLLWFRCALCGKKTETTSASQAMLALSFGKLTELLLYNDVFHPLEQDMCAHASDPFALVRIFLRNDIEVHVKQEVVNLYELRLPTTVDATTDTTDFFVSVRASVQALDTEQEEKAEESLLPEHFEEASLASQEADMLRFIDASTSTTLNDMRYELYQLCVDYEAQLSRHARKREKPESPARIPQLAEPEYVTDETVHVLPSDNDVLIREKEMSSFIAYTLSSSQYKGVFQHKSYINKLPNTLGIETTKEAALTPLPASGAPSVQNSRTASPVFPGPRSAKSSATPSEDWELSAKIKKTVKPTGSILSLKVATPRARLQDIFSLTSAESARLPDAKGAEPAGLPDDESRDDDDKVLEGLLSASKAPANKPTPLGGARSPVLPSLISSLKNRRHISEATTTSVVSDATASATSTPMDVSVQHGRAESIRSISTVDSDLSMTDDESVASESSHKTVKGQDQEILSDLPEKNAHAVAAKGSTFSTLSGFLQRNLRLHAAEEGRPVKQQTGSGPHVKLTFRHGGKKMSCIVYYAEEFAALRKACGLPEALYIKSLERARALQFSGGKTDAGFSLTDDGRFVLKEMRTSWNVSEVDAMLTFAPNYLNYLMTSKRPSLLTKILGMYTCKIKDLKTGDRKKVDWVIMEHLFYDTEVTRKFDLKGIQSRVARTKGEGQTLWDADWVENFQTRLLIHAHHKTILREAISADTEFLQKNNVMDYSALVGVDDKNRTITIGLIDILGIFNLAKAIESNSKRVLQQGDRTIIPPDEYAARFQSALHDYIIASPEKFSKSPGDGDVPVLSCPL